MELAHYLELLHQAERRFADALRSVGDAHADEPDIHLACERLGRQCDGHAADLDPFLGRYREGAPEPPKGLHSDLFAGPRDGGLGLLRDLHDLYLMATECDLVWTLIGQGAQGARDEELLAQVERCEEETSLQLRWLMTQLKQAAPQALVVA